MAKATRSSRPRKILFIGNSFTARNDLPGQIARLAESRGHSLEQRLISAGGASLRRHWNAGEALQAIREGDYSHVVLQEQSTLPIKNLQRMHESIRLFAEAIEAADAKTVLYMTWARQHAPESQQAITQAYTSIGDELGAMVVPVGLAWERFLGEHDQPALHDRDQSHPTFAGTYLAACVFLAFLFRENPIGLQDEIDDLAPKALAALQKTAWEISRGSRRPKDD